ncbi:MULTISPECIES: recombinase family protein [Bradyrhizobium]|uniref:recombinase family protein n=1 Tax=Bradyrhizobium TaxID=374 RepID=UPI002169D7EF|nr:MULTISPECIES: recombinase family protein [Bradyrhizobium]
MNKKGVPEPRGGAWNASTIDGSRKRLNGILRNGCMPGASSGTAKGSSKTRRPASASAAKTRARSG